MAGVSPSNPATQLRPSPSVPSVRGPSSPGSSTRISHPVLTMEQALTQANGNVKAALEAVLAERNVLSGQNAQLWKLIEKQRTQTSTVMKELERIRTERDKAVAKLESSGVGGGDPSSTPTRTRGSPKISSMRAFSTSDDNDQTPSRPKPPRHQSDNSQKERGRSFDDRRTQSPSSMSPNAKGHSSSNHIAALSSTTSVSTMPTGPKQQPQQRSLSHGHITSSPSSQHPQSDQPLSDVPQFSLTSPPTSDSGHTANPPSFSQSHPSIMVDSSPTVTPVDLAPIQSSSTSATLSTFQPRARSATRESRITLPDEASQYIANMQDSPLPSPHLSGQAANATSSLRHQQEATITNGAFPHPHSHIQNSLSGSPTDKDESGASSSGELNQSSWENRDRRTPTPPDDASSIISASSKSRVEEEDMETGGPYDIDVASSVGDDDLFGDNGSSISFQPADGSPYADSRTEKQDHRQREFSASHSESSHASTTSLAYHAPGSGENESLGSIPETTSTLIDSPPGVYVNRAGGSSTPTRSYPQLPPPIQANIPATPPTHPSQVTPQAKPTYRSTRLTLNDLPYTKVRVHGSNIRTNDRGKEVLSFVFAVDPCGNGNNPMRKGGSGKESWLVEKLYSEVLALDTNVRGTIGRSASKKLASLPDGKLFKDHAPAKVDQRKVILETYIQSIVSGNWKSKDDILMFLSTDFVRGGQRNAGVGHSGYKEGYLTKRGKNFGGWKTRYFVLQSPVLEYYESRGGQHLGSISIAGAQIGRQQRSASARESDDENSYRHAFLIIEAKKGPGGAAVRHVLCAESDEERDSWVELLVRYVIAGAQGGKYPASIDSGSEDHRGSPAGSMSTLAGESGGSLMRASVDQQPMSNIQKKLKKEAEGFKYSMESTDERESPIMARRMIERGGTPGPSSETGVSPNQDNLSITSSSAVGEPHASPALRPTMVLDAQNGERIGNGVGARASPTGPVSSSAASVSSSNPAPHPPPPRSIHRASYHPSAVSKSSAGMPEHRAPSPDKPDALTGGKVKISGPIGGTPIPAGYKFGKDPSEEAAARSERDRKAKSRTFWGFGRNNYPAPGGQSGGIPQAVFGVTVETSLAVAQIADLPAIVFRCIEYLEAKKADQEEGIYRLSGSSNVIKSLKDRFNQEGDVDLLKSDEFWDPHAIAGLLKSYFRELPQSILTRELHLRFLGVIDLANPEERIDELAGLISQLPVPNYSLLRALTAHLILIVQNANVNKMTMRNVGIVFSPTLGIPAGVFSLMLGEFEKVFNVHGQGVDLEDALKIDPEKSTAVSGAVGGLDVNEPLSNRNSRSYADGSADRLLGLSGRTLKATDEESDEGDSISIPESSGTETENEGEGGNTNNLNSPPDTPGPSSYVKGEPTLVPRAHSANVAAQRGLQVSVPTGANVKRLSGLPASPRPTNRTQLSGGSNSPASPLLTTTAAGKI